MKNVMIVDDEIMVRVGMKALIHWEEYGFNVIADCCHGIDALEKIEHQEPDLILTDLKMDKMDGFTLIKICNQKYPRIKFIVLSNYNDFENTKKALQLGAIDYIFKLTVTPEELIRALNRANKHLVLHNEKNLAEDKAKHYEKTYTFLRKNITAIKSYLLQMAAEGSYDDEAVMLDDLKQVCPANDFNKPYCVLQISIDTIKNQAFCETLQNLQILKYGIENMISEVMNQDSTAEVYSYFREDFIIVFNTDSFANYAEVAIYARKKFAVMKEYIQRYFSLEITGALSDFCSNLFSLRQAVEKTNRILAYRVEAECGLLHTIEDEQRLEILNVKQYVHLHLAETISLESAAKEVNMSQSYFSHLFKEEMKISFTDYVNRVRIQRACEILKNPNIKINEVSAQVGIENFNYFSVLFKKHTGLPPNKYREQLQAIE